MTKNIKSEQGEERVQVSVTSIGTIKETVKKITVRPFVTDTARVSVSKGATIPTGDYASCKVSVTVTMPCYVEEVPTMYKRLNRYVTKLIDDEMRLIENG